MKDQPLNLPKALAKYENGNIFSQFRQFEINVNSASKFKLYTQKSFAFRLCTYFAWASSQGPRCEHHNVIIMNSLNLDHKLNDGNFFITAEIIILGAKHTLAVDFVQVMCSDISSMEGCFEFHSPKIYIFKHVPT